MTGPGQPQICSLQLMLERLQVVMYFLYYFHVFVSICILESISICNTLTPQIKGAARATFRM